MYLILKREKPQGKAVRGKLYRATYDLQRGCEVLEFIAPTLENADYLIPPLIYPLRVTYSPKFKRDLPLVCQVPERSGIRFHTGTRPEHSAGCILVSRDAEQHLRDLLAQEGVSQIEIDN